MTDERTTNELSMAEIFGPGGLLERCHPGYEFRPGQLEMAEAVEAAFREKQHLIVEAGTGTGKTLAYLIPAIRCGRRVVISTGTKNLQEQLFYKDVPFLQKFFAPDLRVCYMKGRSNFLCRQKLYDLEQQPALKGMEEVDLYAHLREWEKVTETGDRAELPELPDQSTLWTRMDARRETCTGQKCAEFARCFITWMHQRAHESDIIIVNHHLFFADLALQQDDFGRIIPDYSAIVFDEAHELEDVASNYFGLQVSNYRLEELARDADQTLKFKNLATPPLARTINQLRDRARRFFELFPQEEGRFGFDDREEFLEKNEKPYRDLRTSLTRLETALVALRERPEEILNLARRAQVLRTELEFLLESRERNFVYWWERRNRGVFLQATPIDVSAILREQLFDRYDTIVLTSATLAVANHFDYLRARLGIQHAKDKVLEPHFDYGRQALLYIPTSLPDPRAANFLECAMREVVQLLEMTRGRAFVLFTSYQQMNALYRRLLAEITFPLFLQGTAPKTVLLDRFRQTPHAVLLATASFWQGVDVPGPQLSCVIIDKLPFAVPTEPIVAARIRALTDDGHNAFEEYQLPEAIIALKQGFGRLIRSRSDRGILAILDNRIVRKQYGRMFFESLPGYAVTEEISAVARFLEAGSA